MIESAPHAETNLRVKAHRDHEHAAFAESIAANSGARSICRIDRRLNVWFAHIYETTHEPAAFAEFKGVHDGR
jgi:hypothetical protein